MSQKALRGMQTVKMETMIQMWVMTTIARMILVARWT